MLKWRCWWNGHQPWNGDVGGTGILPVTIPGICGTGISRGMGMSVERASCPLQFPASVERASAVEWGCRWNGHQPWNGDVGGTGILPVTIPGICGTGILPVINIFGRTLPTGEEVENQGKSLGGALRGYWL
ncbi:hypothetical protein [Moorena sp. SIO3H5]|uniref:hypothetical protein n=1 Tax=Moorena sp. SIO3H5 TaxID=2607834 RepID=UPI0013BD3142|nr:hypothetical protein [Moorena sp. SIO3H5]NEO69192.1 hypothetical protein [Moorena sp. SIO3H5]